MSRQDAVEGDNVDGWGQTEGDTKNVVTTFENNDAFYIGESALGRYSKWRADWHSSE